MIIIHLDTEFSALASDARLISIGLVSEDGERTFYAELSDTYTAEDCGDFVKDHVLPLLEGGEVRMTWSELTPSLKDWIESYPSKVTIATDSLAWDWRWIIRIFLAEGSWPLNLENHPLLLTMNYLHNFDAFQAFLEQSYAGDGALRRHHSLDDAEANRRAWLLSGKHVI